VTLAFRNLADWHRLVVEIDANPWGRTARQVEEVFSHSRPYGIADAMELALSRARDRAESSERVAVGDPERAYLPMSAQNQEIEPVGPGFGAGR
jgi:hypothetical protein